MQVKFHTFPVGSGDCITLLLKNDDKEMHIMVDCGLYTQEVNDFIVNEFHSRIDYLTEVSQVNKYQLACL